MIPLGSDDEIRLRSQTSLQVPRHPAFKGCIIQTDGAAILTDRNLVKEAAAELQFHNIGLSIGNLAASWPALMEIDDFAFGEIKVDRQFIAGCAGDRMKQKICRRVLAFVVSAGARTAAHRVKT